MGAALWNEALPHLQRIHPFPFSSRLVQTKRSPFSWTARQKPQGGPSFSAQSAGLGKNPVCRPEALPSKIQLLTCKD